MVPFTNRDRLAQRTKFLWASKLSFLARRRHQFLSFLLFYPKRLFFQTSFCLLDFWHLFCFYVKLAVLHFLLCCCLSKFLSPAFGNRRKMSSEESTLGFVADDNEGRFINNGIWGAGAIDCFCSVSEHSVVALAHIYIINLCCSCKLL